MAVKAKMISPVILEVIDETSTPVKYGYCDIVNWRGVNGTVQNVNQQQMTPLPWHAIAYLKCNVLPRVTDHSYIDIS